MASLDLEFRKLFWSSSRNILWDFKKLRFFLNFGKLLLYEDVKDRSSKFGQMAEIFISSIVLDDGFLSLKFATKTIINKHYLKSYVYLPKNFR